MVVSHGASLGATVSEDKRAVAPPLNMAGRVSSMAAGTRSRWPDGDGWRVIARQPGRWTSVDN